ncbi:hypothetical protein DEU56DRAFT_757320 [Suillus clintonianus]|uniref:uncharacterized protein n=1 Tax=Suillus clintonianus TaxID=1904413 RepID=UPI001B885672|nr:uncharacterized protein DEU56DRAFT_757320 [Suillus clintonianus]KAG2132332.1 hypothetical protein DEU56DRAFT_757320 [Suillus clintonianus]
MIETRLLLRCDDHKQCLACGYKKRASNLVAATGNYNASIPTEFSRYPANFSLPAYTDIQRTSGCRATILSLSAFVVFDFVMMCTGHLRMVFVVGIVDATPLEPGSNANQTSRSRSEDLTNMPSSEWSRQSTASAPIMQIIFFRDGLFEYAKKKSRISQGRSTISGGTNCWHEIRAARKGDREGVEVDDD